MRYPHIGVEQLQISWKSVQGKPYFTCNPNEIYRIFYIITKFDKHITTTFNNWCTFHKNRHWVCSILLEWEYWLEMKTSEFLPAFSTCFKIWTEYVVENTYIIHSAFVIFVKIDSRRVPQVSSPKPSISLSAPLYALYPPPISLFSILSSEKYWVRGADH